MKVSIYTDGAARGNPDGPGGYGVVLEYVDRRENFTLKSFPAAMCGQPITGWS